MQVVKVLCSVFKKSLEGGKHIVEGGDLAEERVKLPKNV